MKPVESILIVVALLSLLPMIRGYHIYWWYQAWLAVVLVALIWVTRRQLQRTREAAEESTRKREAGERGGRPPTMK